MIIPEFVKLQNFASYGKEQVFEFYSNGVYLVEAENRDDINHEEGGVKVPASNGSGKSSLPMSLEYVLFGKVSKKLTHEDLIHEDYGSNMFVQFQFVDTDSDIRYRVERYRKHNEFGNNLYLYEFINDQFEDISKSTKEETQKDIENIILINQASFIKSILLNSNDGNRFLEMNKTGRADIIENVIQLSKLKKKHRENKKNLTDAKKKIEILKADKSRFFGELNIIKRNITNELESKNSFIKNKQEDIKQCKNILGVYSKYDLSQLEDYKNYKLRLKEHKQKEKEREREILSKKADFKKLKQRYEKQKSIVEKNINKYKEDMIFECNVCGTKHELDGGSMKQHIIDLKKEKKEIKQEIDNAKKELKKILELDTCKDFILEEYDLPDNIDDLIETNAINEIKETAIKKKNIEEDRFDNSRIKKYIKDYKETLQEFKQIKKELKAEEKKRAIYLYWNDALDLKSDDSIKQYIVLSIVPVLNEITQKIMDFIYDGKVSVTFDQKFEETIIKNGKIKKYNTLSDGEKSKINLVLNLALFELISFNLKVFGAIFFDEVFRAIDPATIHKFVDLIESKYANKSACYIISHARGTEEAIGTDSIIKIIKENNESRILM